MAMVNPKITMKPGFVMIRKVKLQQKNQIMTTDVIQSEGLYRVVEKGVGTRVELGDVVIARLDKATGVTFDGKEIYYVMNDSSILGKVEGIDE